LARIESVPDIQGRALVNRGSQPRCRTKGRASTARASIPWPSPQVYTPIGREAGLPRHFAGISQVGRDDGRTLGV